MNQVFKKRRTTLTLLISLSLSLLQIHTVQAHGNLDQSSYVNGPPYYFEYTPYSIIVQEFRPTKSSIVGVDLLVHNIGGAGVKNIQLTLYKGALGANWQGYTNDAVYVPEGYS